MAHAKLEICRRLRPHSRPTEPSGDGPGRWHAHPAEMVAHPAEQGIQEVRYLILTKIHSFSLQFFVYFHYLRKYK